MWNRRLDFGASLPVLHGGARGDLKGLSLKRYACMCVCVCARARVRVVFVTVPGSDSLSFASFAGAKGICCVFSNVEVPDGMVESSGSGVGSFALSEKAGSCPGWGVRGRH